MSDSILRKPLTGLLLLAGAAGGPYVLFETDIGSQARRTAGGVFSSSSDAPPPGRLTSMSTDPQSGTQPWQSWADPASAPMNATVASDPQQLLPPTPIHSLGDILRFDISPPWVTASFPRVSTVLANLQLDGLRVPLVTGTTPDDLAGTLTYYFDSYKRLQRISLQAVSGNPTRAIAELQQRYQLQQEPSLGGGLYMMKWNGQPTSVLHVAPAAVIRADAPYSRFNLFLELNQPGLEYGLSQEARDFVAVGRANNRW